MKKDCFIHACAREKLKKLLLVMKLSSLLMLLFCMNLSAGIHAQEAKFSVVVENSNIREIIRIIKQQSDYTFVYNVEELDHIGSITMNVKDSDVRTILDACVKNSGYTYSILDKVIVIRKAELQQQEQIKKIRGTVTDKKKAPLPGVTVLIKGTSIGVATDMNGKFEMIQPKDSNIVLIISFIGMKTITIPYKGQDLTVVMEEDSQEMDEVVVTGYQVVDRRKNTSAVTSVKMEDIMIPGASSVDQMLQGQIPDMMFMSNSGEVGVVPKLRIRGTSTLIGNREPLWVVDGIIIQDPVEISPEELNDPDYINRIGNAIAGLNPQDIDRIDVLKDAAATALYGTKAANGVIVITTKKGHVGRPVVTYSMNMTLRQRPSYNDRSVNVMNSQERMRFSRELVAQHYQFPNDMSMVGYEGLITKLYNHEIDIQQFDQEVAKLETVNTDWFDLLTRNSLSHQHTISISGGSEEARYYASIGYNRDNDVIGDDNNERYTATLNLDANLTPWLTASLSMNGNVSSRDYYQNELAPMQYAYKTTRALPAFDEKGEYYFYQRKYNNYTYYNFNILNELENSSYGQEGSALTVNANLQFKFTNWLNANAIVSYSTSHTTIEGWWGEKSYHAALLRGSEYGVPLEPAEWDDYWEEWSGSAGYSELPYGGELSRQETNNNSYTVRLQLNANKYFGTEDRHNINASAGFELSSTRYKQYENVTRGYYKDRGMSFVNNINLDDYPAYKEWLASNVPSLSDQLTNTISAYASVSYSYFNYFTVNVNARVDGSNGFGDQSNDKLLPIWSASANWNISEHDWMQTSWIDFLRLKASFGYQGNMLSDQTPVMIISKKPLDSYFNENISKVERYPNPDLKWETTKSYNLGLELSLFKNKVQLEGSYYWKHTEDAFMTKTIASMNGVNGNSYVVNGGDVDNSGYSVAVTVSPINNKDVRWTLSTSFSKTFNKMQSDPDANEYELDNFLNGTALVKGKPIGTFYSYKFLGLSPVDGAPIFDDYVDNKEVLRGLSKYDTYTRVLEASGNREPTISGSLNTTVRWKNFRLSGSFAYSMGNKIRLFAMYSPEADATMNANEIRAENNVSKDYLRRWQKPGDELHTDIPAIISPGSDAYYKYYRHWSDMSSYSDIRPIANSVWNMYDYGNHRVVSGNYLKCSNLSLTYEFGEHILNKLHMSRLALTLSGANLFTICSSKLKGQTPTQSGFATIQLSDRPNYSLGLTISF